MDGSTRSAKRGSNQHERFGPFLGSDPFSGAFPVNGGEISPNSTFGALRQLPDQLQNWYHNDDEPWNPYAAPAGVDSRGPGLPPSFTNYQTRPVPSVLSECGTAPTGFVQSDSGYASGPRPSIGNPSVYDDIEHGCETQSISYQLSGFQIEQSRVEEQNVNDHDHRTNLGGFSNEAQPGNPSGTRQTRICRDCNQEVKTNSELKKHEHKHKKPFQCDVHDCPRQYEGFTSSSDLLRHKRTKHRGMDGIPAGDNYRCPGGCRGRNQGKPINRSDNFRAHMKKCHQINLTSDDDLSPYRVENLPLSSTPALAGLGYPVDNGLRVPSDTPLQTIPDQWALERSMSNAGNQHIDNQAEQVQFEGPAVTRSFASSLESAFTIQGGEPTGVPTSQFPTRFVPNHFVYHERPSEKTEYEMGEVLVALNRSDTPQAKVDWKKGPPVAQNVLSRGSVIESDLAGSTSVLDEPKQTALPKSTKAPNSSELSIVAGQDPHNSRIGQEDHKVIVENSEAAETISTEPGELVIDLTNEASINSALHTLAEHKGDRLKKMLEKLGYQKIGDSTRSGRKYLSVTGAINKCSRCSKTFQQPYQLNKHMMRHERPYGCTFPCCPKLFGSKNDWKRHESTQHSQLEIWKCLEPVKDDELGQLCHKVCHRPATMVAHLQQQHGICNAAQLEHRLTEYRTGRGCEPKFWCGFCESMISTKQKGLNAWGARIDHIADHYTGRNNLPKQSVWEWKQIDSIYDLLTQVRDSDSAEDDDDSAAEPDPRSQQARHGSGQHRKRRASSDDDTHQSQKRRQVVGTWVCCRCQTTCKNAFSCERASCDHEFCDNCIGERRRAAVH